MSMTPSLSARRLAAGSKGTDYILLPGVTQPKEQMYVKKQERATVKWVVALHTRTKTSTWMRVHGTTENMCDKPLPEYLTRAGKAALGFCTEEYLKILERLFPEDKRRSCNRGPQWVEALVHDRDPVHQTKEVEDFLHARGIKNCLLPPRSPDLDPLDYCVFGCVKRSVRVVDDTNLDGFKKKCATLESKLGELDVERKTSGFKARLLRVVKAKGGHI